MDDAVPETLLVILGAGASHDCVPLWQLPGRGSTDTATAGQIRIECAGLPTLTLDDCRPPLTQNLAEATPLVNWALDRWPQARPAVAHLREALRSTSDDPAQQVLSLEEALANFQADAVIVPENTRSLLAFRFFLRDLIWASTNYMMSGNLTGGITNYTYLLKALSTWAGLSDERRVVIVSFNYDLLLERAMTSLWGFEPTSLPQYLNHRRISLLKPHGSLQWLWPTATATPMTTDSQMGLGARAIGMSPFQEDRSAVLTTSQATFEEQVMERTRVAVPAMALPIVGKTEFCWPDGQSKRLEEQQGRATRVLTIGWRGLEGHFTPLLRPIVTSHAKALVVVGRPGGDSEAQEIRHRLQAQTDCDLPRWDTYSHGFTRLIEVRRLNTFLDIA